MAVYSLAMLATNVASATPLWDIKAPVTGRPSITEICLSNAVTSTATTVGIGRPATNGSQLGPMTPIADDPDDPPALSSCAVNWTVAPTVPTQFFRRSSLASTAGVAMLWTWPRGLLVGSGKSIVLWNIAVNNILYAVNVVVDE